ncbi:MAG: hypothetical protein DBX61_04180 [Clostridiales bacterium]|nr:MAG: hypothetical protein DBX61_04180 [Clostridiales bacterium]
MNRFNFIAEGFKGFVRNGVRSAASVLILGSSLLLIGIFTTLIVTINQSISNIDDFNEIVVYMNLTADAETVSAASEAINALKNVKSVEFISKAEALKSEKEKFDEEFAYIFDSYDETTNPLPDTFKIEYESIDSIDALVYNLERIEGVDKVKNRYDIAKNIENFKNAISLGGTWLMILLVAVSVFVISNTIKLTYHAREMEITVMRYIGATKWYITMPFVFEGAIIGAVSGVLGYAVQYYLYRVPLTELSERFDGFVKIPSFGELNIYYLLIFFAAGILLGVIGSAFAIRKYMKV